MQEREASKSVFPSDDGAAARGGRSADGAADATFPRLVIRGKYGGKVFGRVSIRRPASRYTWSRMRAGASGSPYPAKPLRRTLTQR